MGGLCRKLMLGNCTTAQNKALGCTEAAGEQSTVSQDVCNRTAQTRGWFWAVGTAQGQWWPGHSSGSCLCLHWPGWDWNHHREGPELLPPHGPSDQYIHWVWVLPHAPHAPVIPSCQDGPLWLQQLHGLWQPRGCVFHAGYRRELVENLSLHKSRSQCTVCHGQAAFSPGWTHSPEVQGRNWGLQPRVLGSWEVLRDERGKTDQGQLPHPHGWIVWLVQSPGAGSPGGGCGDVGKEPLSPPRLHLHGAGAGNDPSAISKLEKNGEMAEGLLQIPIIVNKSSIYPKLGRRQSQRAPNEGQQLQGLLPPKERGPSLQQGGDRGAWQVPKPLTLDFKGLSWCVSPNI